MAFARAVLQKMLLESPSDEHFDARLVIENPGAKGGETVIRAHRIVLSTVSEVFCGLFRSGLREHSEGVVRVSDFSAPAVAEALSLIYGGELGAAERDWKLAGQVWDFGHRFRVEHVSNLARAAALTQVCEENCLRVLGFALHIGDDAAAEQIRDFISDETHFANVVRSAEFALASHDVVAALRRPPSGSFAEPDILTFEKVWFDALVAWADANVDTVPSADDASTEQDKLEVRRTARLDRAFRLVDFGRMRTHELRECHRNPVAQGSPTVATMLVAVLLVRAEKLENSLYEKERDLEELGAAYQVALFGKNEAERSARIAGERLEKSTSHKLTEDKPSSRRRNAGSGGSGGPNSNGYTSERRSSASYGRRRGSNPSSPIL